MSAVDRLMAAIELFETRRREGHTTALVVGAAITGATMVFSHEKLAWNWRQKVLTRNVDPEGFKEYQRVYEDARELRTATLADPDAFRGASGPVVFDHFVWAKLAQAAVNHLEHENHKAFAAAARATRDAIHASRLRAIQEGCVSQLRVELEKERRLSTKRLRKLVSLRRRQRHGHDHNDNDGAIEYQWISVTRRSKFICRSKPEGRQAE